MMSRVAAVNSLKSLARRTAGLLVLMVAAAAIGFGIEYLTSVLDVELPFRQVLFGRNWNALTMQRRFAWVIVAGCSAAVFAGSRPKAAGQRPASPCRPALAEASGRGPRP